MKYSFILEIDDISKDDINELVNILSDNKIKFHVLKSDKELKENQKYKEVINKLRKVVDKMIDIYPANNREYDYYVSKLDDLLEKVKDK